MKKIFGVLLIFSLIIGLVGVNASEVEVGSSEKEDYEIIYLTDQEYAEKESKRSGKDVDVVLLELQRIRDDYEMNNKIDNTTKSSGYYQVAELVKSYIVSFDTGGQLTTTYKHIAVVNMYINPPYGSSITAVLNQGVEVYSGSNGYEWDGSSSVLNSWSSSHVSITDSGNCIVDVPSGSINWRSGVTVGSVEAYMYKVFSSYFTV